MTKLPYPTRFPPHILVTALMGLCLLSRTEAADVTIINPGFEDTTGQSTFREFTFGPPIVGWDVYDPNGIVPDGNVFVGTLEPNGVEFFNDTAPEGDLVAILFNRGREGEGEYGFFQELSETLQANTAYSLSVEVGNIASGTDTNGTFYDLSDFPGYRIEIMVETDVADVFEVIGTPDSSLIIPEGEFATATVNVSVDPTHPYLGNNLGIRLVNLNQIPEGDTQETSPDLEVDFDAVSMTATPIPMPIPATIAITDPGGQPALSFQTSAANNYSIRAADEVDGNYEEIDTLAGTGSSETVVDPRPLSDRQFYLVYEE